MITIFSVAVTGLEICSCCDSEVEVLVYSANTTKEDFVADIDELFRHRMERQGWKDGYCPACARVHADELRKAANADDARKEIECSSLCHPEEKCCLTEDGHCYTKEDQP